MGSRGPRRSANNRSAGTGLAPPSGTGRITGMSPLPLIPLMSSLLLLPASPAEDADKTPLQKRFEEVTTELHQAEARLEEAYLGLEQSFAAIAGNTAETAAALATALHEITPEYHERLLRGRGGRAPTRAAQLVLIKEVLTASLAQAGIDALLHGPLSEFLAEPLLQSLLDPDLAGVDQRTAEEIDRFFDTDREFAAIWNEHIFQRVEAAREYARTHAIYIEAGRRVERERNPERFDEGGQRLPPGMVQIKGGSYEIGPHDGWERKGLGKRSKRVTLRTFYIDKHEVTNADYRVFWSTLTPEQRGVHLPRYWVELPESEGGGFDIPAGKEDHPVVGVSFNDALAFATWANKRLPTEDEWEAAARGPKGLKYPWGADYEAGRANDREAALGATAPVGAFPDGSAWSGCQDLSGNVEEWTASTADGDDVIEPLDSNLIQMVIRGGNFNTNSDGVAATFRWISPGLSTRKPHLGFRCAQSGNK